jgi:hypothetical protein
MRQTTRHLIVSLMMIGVTSAGRPARADDLDAETVRHVRSSNASFVALIGLASQQSKTFRGLIEASIRVRLAAS